MTHRAKPGILVAVGIIFVGLMAGCGVDPIEELSRKIESPRTTTREQAIIALANLRDGRAIELLTDALANDEELHDNVAVALVKHGRRIPVARETNPVIEQVSKAAKNTHLGEQFRARAIWVLGEIGDRRSIPLLNGLADAQKPILTQQAVEALEKLGFNSADRSYELPMGSLAEDLEVIPEISEMKPPPPT
ncbi:MAG: hypothetical protein KAW89_08120 [Armatimonadetes bacterium]|nr:hypothetical protein [Armatimonadota bacterium]